MKGGLEYDAFTGWRRVLCYMQNGRGIRKWIKRKFNKRERKAGRCGMMPKGVQPFQTACRGENCGVMIWMVPMVKVSGKPGWGPMDLDPDLPDEPPEEWDATRSHYLSCPDADTFAPRGGRK